MDLEGLPASIRAKHPEAVQIAEALRQHASGVPVTARCPVCDQVLVVTEIPEIGSTWVRCPNGHVNYHARSTPRVPPDAADASGSDRSPSW